MHSFSSWPSFGKEPSTKSFQGSDGVILGEGLENGIFQVDGVH
jgi:hypothetical protein